MEKRKDILLEMNPQQRIRYDRMASEYMSGVKNFYAGKKVLITKVVFNPPATIVYWWDGSKTVVKCTDEVFDHEKGLAMAIAKKMLGNQGNYYNEFKKWLPKQQDDDVETVESSRPSTLGILDNVDAAYERVLTILASLTLINELDMTIGRHESEYDKIIVSFINRKNNEHTDLYTIDVIFSTQKYLEDIVNDALEKLGMK